jgi:trehalose 6-phosphate phosphatase
MPPLPLSEALPEIADRIDRSERILLGLDFDGTLTPLQSLPHAVHLAEDVRDILAQLASNPRVTPMIVSGRAVSDVASRVGLPNLIYAGNHGMEIQGPGISFVEPTAAALAENLAELSETMLQRLNQPGAIVEPKGLTMSVHFRNVLPNQRSDLARTVQDVVSAHSDDFIISSGLCVWEIRPRVPWHKGYALLLIEKSLMDPSPLVIYSGDDQTDEDAFSVLPNAVTVKVGDSLAPSQARYWLPNPEAVKAFLTWVLERLASKSPAIETTE